MPGRAFSHTWHGPPESGPICGKGPHGEIFAAYSKIFTAQSAENDGAILRTCKSHYPQFLKPPGEKPLINTDETDWKTLPKWPKLPKIAEIEIGITEDVDDIKVIRWHRHDRATSPTSEKKPQVFPRASLAWA
jgi:hypothetical protein